MIFQRDKIHIPEAWSGEQALAVYELLEEIGLAIWNVHEKAILKAMSIENPNHSASSSPIHLDDEDSYPF